MSLIDQNHWLKGSPRFDNNYELLEIVKEIRRLHDRLDKIDERLAILDRTKDLTDEHSMLRQAYNEYKVLESILGDKAKETYGDKNDTTRI